MNVMMENNNIICGSCGQIIERSRANTYCSNCFACTGCEIYYCPKCDEEIVVKPIRKRRENDCISEQSH